MYIFEMFQSFENDSEAADQSESKPEDFRFDAANDNSRMKITDTRKVRITLRHIQKLRQMNELRAIEMNQRLKRIRKIYAAPAQEGGL